MKHLALSLVLVGALSNGASSEEIVPAFVRGHCAECHNAKTKEGGLDLTKLVVNPSQPVELSMLTN